MMPELNLKKYVSVCFSGVFLLLGFQVFIRFITSIVMARYLGAQGYGVFSYAISWIMILIIFTKFGFDSFIAREIPVYETRNERGYILGLCKYAQKFTLILAFIVMAIFIVILNLLKHHLTSLQFTTLEIAAFILPSYSLISVQNGIIKGVKRVVTSQLSEMVIIPFLFLVIILVFHKLLLPRKIDPIQSMEIRFIVMLITLLISWFAYTLIKNRYFKTDYIKFNRAKWTKTSGIFMLMGSVFMVNNYIGTLLLGLIADPKAVGIYRVVFVLASMVAFVLTALKSMLSPIMSELYVKKLIPKMQKVVSYGSAAATVFTLPAVLFFLIYGRLFVQYVYGNDFASHGIIALDILVIGQFIAAFCGPCAIVLQSSGFEKIVLKISAAALFINLLLNITLIPKYGVNGAAFSSAASSVIMSMVLVYYVFNKIKINPIAISILTKK